mmetsp:Transcript_90609/g.253159  ORF Transcript_90609/g.253159 Transcript_90609/m.253159 type:complete len:223 (-) Transcript_90609:328-996(-)
MTCASPSGVWQLPSGPWAVRMEKFSKVSERQMAMPGVKEASPPYRQEYPRSKSMKARSVTKEDAKSASSMAPAPSCQLLFRAPRSRPRTLAAWPPKKKGAKAQGAKLYMLLKVSVHSIRTARASDVATGRLSSASGGNTNRQMTRHQRYQSTESTAKNGRGTPPPCMAICTPAARAWLMSHAAHSLTCTTSCLLPGVDVEKYPLMKQNPGIITGIAMLISPM